MLKGRGLDRTGKEYGRAISEWAKSYACFNKADFG
jgi:hypothetical protein